jgi:hypothetical protein
LNVTPFSTWNSSHAKPATSTSTTRPASLDPRPRPRPPRAPHSDPSYTTTFRRGYTPLPTTPPRKKGRNNNNMRGIIVTSAATAAACCCLAAAAAAAAAGSSGSSGMFGIAGGRRNLASSFAGLDARGGAVGERVIFRYRPHDFVVCFSKLRLFRW